MLKLIFNVNIFIFQVCFLLYVCAKTNCFIIIDLKKGIIVIKKNMK